MGTTVLMAMITSIIVAAITGYTVTWALAKRLMDELDEVEQRHREKLMMTTIELISSITQKKAK